MNITAELLDGDIKAAEAQQAQLQANLNQCMGFLSALRQMRDLLDKPDPQTPEADGEEQGHSLGLADQGLA